MEGFRAAMRACFTSDLHGSETLYQQLDKLLLDERPDVALLGGDLTIDGDLADPLGTQVRYVREVFAPRLRRWHENNSRLTVGVIVGNHEWACTLEEWQRLERAGALRVLDLYRPLCINNTSILGYGLTPPTPFYAKDFERRDSAGEAPLQTSGYYWDAAARAPRPCDGRDWYARHNSIEQDLAAAPAPRSPWIFVCHAPPHATNLDNMHGSTAPVGSRAVREFIERHGPVLTLHGHIHESPELSGAFRQQLGRALCVNPGQARDRLHAVLFDVDAPVSTLRHTVYG